MNIKELGIIILLGAIWGASFLFLRIASPVFGPFLTIELRVLVASVVLMLYAKLKNRDIDLRSKWKEYLILGLVNAAVPFTFFSLASLTLEASFESILNSTTPLFAVIFAWMFLGEKLNARKLLGVGLGIVGVIVLVGWNPMDMTLNVILASILCILASAAYGLAGIYVKKTFKGIDPLTLTIGQHVGATILLFPIAILNMPSAEITTAAIGAVLGMGIVSTAFAYLLYFYMIEKVGPTKTMNAGFIVPVFGIIWGAIFLNEKITISLILGFVIILAGVITIVSEKTGENEIENVKRLRRDAV